MTMRIPYKMALLCARVRRGGPLRREPHELRGHCPAHDDKCPSLYIALTEELHGLVRCRGGCSAESIMQAADMSVADLFYAQDPWVELDENFQIVREDVEPDPDAFRANERRDPPADDQEAL